LPRPELSFPSFSPSLPTPGIYIPSTSSAMEKHHQSSISHRPTHS
jgi:hypothetical protein